MGLAGDFLQHQIACPLCGKIMESYGEEVGCLRDSFFITKKDAALLGSQRSVRLGDRVVTQEFTLTRTGPCWVEQ